jgi:acyl-CoA dehydrogenase
MDFEISSELSDIIAGLTLFLDSEIVPRHHDNEKMLSDPRQVYDGDGRFSEAMVDLLRDVRTASARAGYYTMFVPEEIGGGGLGWEALFRVWQHVFHRYGTKYNLATETIAHWARGPSHVLRHATSAARERVLPDLLAGKTTMCFGMSEPDAGSDALRMSTVAVRDGSQWVITGSKIWISNGPYADYAIIFAVTDRTAGPGGRPGISAFLVPTDTPGFTADANIRMFNEIGGSESTIYLDEVRVDDDMLLGELNRGFGIAMSGVSSGRMFNSAKGVGLARWAFDQTIEYSQRRYAFGKPISANQGVTFPLADSAMEIHAAHLMALHCAWMLDNGWSALKELNMTKLFATEMAVRVIDRSMQIHGAIGFTNELGLFKAYEAARKVCVADGTSEILRRTIAKRLMGGDLDL